MFMSIQNGTVTASPQGGCSCYPSLHILCISLLLLSKNVFAHLVMTLPCWSCPLRFQSRLTWSWPLCLYLARSYPTTTSATLPDMDAPPVSHSHSSVWKIWLHLSAVLHFCPASVCLQPMEACPAEWGRSFFTVSTSRPAPAQAGGGARSRPAWSVQAMGRSRVVMWVGWTGGKTWNKAFIDSGSIQKSGKFLGKIWEISNLKHCYTYLNTVWVTNHDKSYETCSFSSVKELSQSLSKIGLACQISKVKSQIG